MTIRLEKHYSIDKPEPYFYIYAENLALYSTKWEYEARERFKLIKELGIKEYIERIRIKSDILLEEPVND